MFNKGDRFVVSSVNPLRFNDLTYHEGYPRLGWTGTIGRNEFFGTDRNTSYYVRWDEQCKKEASMGDLVREGMISKIILNTEAYEPILDSTRKTAL